jgi:uncharacterized protein YwgA
VSSQTIVNSATDIMLALLYAPGATGAEGEPIRGYTRLEKLMFLIDKETNLGLIMDKEYQFEAKDFGPCAEEIYDDIEMLKDSGILQTMDESSDSDLEDVDSHEGLSEVEDEPTPRTQTATVFRLTSKGMVIGKKIFDAIDLSERKKLVRIKTIYNSKPISETLRYVYTTYDEYTTKSTIKDKVLERRPD